MGEKINTGRLNVVGLILLLFGLSFIGFAMTGKIISNGDTLSDYCGLDIECSSGKICCIISGVQGMCQTTEICDELKSNLGGETPLKIDYSSYVNVGINLVIFAIIIFITAYMAYKKESKRENSRNKKFKKRR